VLLLNDLDPAAFHAAVTPLGLPADVAPRLFAQVHKVGAPLVPERERVRGLGRAPAQALVAAGATAGRLEIVTRRRSTADSFVKYLFRTHDGKLIEAVLIPLPAGPDARPTKYVLCVSSQAGCALGCVFCATGRLGFDRNLATWEIVDQVARIRDDLAAGTAGAHPAPIRGLVFMGQGEPFLNYDRVIAATRILSHPAAFAIDARKITISTAGIVPAIRRFTAEGHKLRLAISLTSAIEDKRARLMPIEQVHPLAELLSAAREHQAKAGGRMMLEYVMISGENVGRDDAVALIDRLAGLPTRLNLIDVNDTTGRYQPPTAAELADFRRWLAPLGQPVVRRYSGGKDVDGACGMLAADHLVPLGGPRLRAE
jgi:23S rRNA (adenine2503-C2)-methyltransferase